ncbi:helix-turn-helix domain-containing protein [Nocardiopsis dassonvillei]|uniref:helix-turn-helix domain-containing protein n=1 Tax=Nocardiopsis dassonvillei TaxID=2014 RepID=UPI00366D5012
MAASKPVTLNEVGALPVWVDPATAGDLLGMSRTVVYTLLDADTFPVPAYKVGRQWRIPTAGILAHLGLQAPTRVCCGCGARRDQHQEVDLGHT